MAFAAVTGLAVVGALWMSATEAPPERAGSDEAAPRAWANDAATYVGTARCASCHEGAADAFRGSHHDRAMEEPGQASVLAPFAGESLEHDGTLSTFVRRGDEYRVRTRGPNGEPGEYRVAYTFGVEPLQQYLLDLGGGRLQALTLAWDARPEAEGGQRWYDLYPGEDLGPDHPLFWAHPAQNWNYVCADCHSTALTRGYGPQTDTFDTRWAELDVGCEACHGPGSAHVAWAEAGAEGSPAGLVASLNEGRRDWVIAAGAANASPHGGASHEREVETCAPCHSRREQLREGRRPDQPFLDAYRPELLIGGLYHDDGQIDAEVYVYGSFVQSRMFHAGVRCSDCHGPHSLALRREGNALCGGCHDEAVYDGPQHHHHASVAGSACVDCHMPARTYMGVDPRRDHSFRIPRPTLASAIGAPDACTSCHEGEPAGWATGKLADWYGAERAPGWGAAFHAARVGAPGAGAALSRLVRERSTPAIVRGTAYRLLGNGVSGANGSSGAERTLRALRRGLESPEPLVRLGAVQGAASLPAEVRFALLRPALNDRLLAIRVEATRGLIDVPREGLGGREREALERAIGELLELERGSADRPDAQLRIANIELSRGDPTAADRALRRALELDPRFVPAMVNLADLRRLQGDELAAEELLRRAVGVDPTSAEAWYALGLSRVRSGHPADAVGMLARAAELRPENPRFAQVLAVALADGGDLRAAIGVLQHALERHPRNRVMLQTLVEYARAAGDQPVAAEAVARLATVGS